MQTREQAVQIPVAGGTVVDADLTLPVDAVGLVLFAHGSGSGRHSPRNRAVAASLNERGLATVLADLLTVQEEQADAASGHLRFDIGLLADRLAGIRRWAASEPATEALSIGCFGASTGAGAALMAAAECPGEVRAVVSRGGRPDLAGDHLPRVTAPTLLIVGGADTAVLDMNRQARGRMTAETELVVVPGATHLFEEAGALEQVASLAGDWFSRHLARPTTPWST